MFIKVRLKINEFYFSTDYSISRPCPDLDFDHFYHNAISDKKQSVSAMLSWLMIIYLVPVVGILAYLIFGEVKLGTKRANTFRRLAPKFNQWFGSFSQCPQLINHHNTLLYRPIFDLAKSRLNIPCVLGNELHILDTPESIIKALSKTFIKLNIALIWCSIFGGMAA